MQTNPNAKVINKVTSLGTTLKVTLEPLEGERVRVLEYYRKAKRASQFKRVKSEEGQVISFDKLNLEQSFDELFAEAA